MRFYLFLITSVRMDFIFTSLLKTLLHYACWTMITNRTPVVLVILLIMIPQLIMNDSILFISSIFPNERKDLHRKITTKGGCIYNPAVFYLNIRNRVI